jgi:hypothetical protein
MAKKAKKKPPRRKAKITEWGVGQPLAFPPSRTEFERLAREAVEEAILGPFRRKPQKRKKK